MVLPGTRIDLFGENRLRTLKTFLFIALCMPAATLVFDLVSGALIEPVEELTKTTGIWALRLLLVTLAITPIRKLTGWHKLIRFRRMLGVFSFTYMTLHFSIYLFLDRLLSGEEIFTDLTERPYIIAGFTCFMLCVPLALTSTDRMMRRLGGRHWQRLHRLVYPAAIAAALHFIWLVKADITEPIIYASILALLLGWRLRVFMIKSDRRSGTKRSNNGSGQGSTPVMGQSS
ncbi:MAG: protein-methionine-sulfoxide reductase heme-binding subunit MsrQ [marine bacterium B5-7]|nr:MAG: protein-methionine-sulfoxide reductase heme-binding subunit MsrQ [marine bacterium B5-7]